MNNHLVFVYGSLKSGFCNHRVIESDNSTLVAQAKTQDGNFMMVSYGVYPAVYRDNDGFAISGELYEVDNAIMARLDQLESNGRFYRRELVDVVVDDDSLENPTVKAWMYLLLREPPRCWDGIAQVEDDTLEWVGR